MIDANALIASCGGEPAAEQVEVISLEPSRKDSDMYANIVFTDEDQEQDAEMRQYVVETILPGVEKTPGFVYGMWFAPAQSKGVSVTIWEDQELAEEAVRGLLARVETTPIPGSTIYRIDTVEVIGETGRPIQAR